MEVSSKMPAGFNTLSAYIVVDDAAAAIELYKNGLGAELISEAKMPEDGKIMNAQMRIGNSMLMLMDEFPDHNSMGPNKRGGTSVTLHLYVDDVDASYQKAVDAGFTAVMPPSDQFWGDRWGLLADPFGHSWSMATPLA